MEPTNGSQAQKPDEGKAMSELADMESSAQAKGLAENAKDVKRPAMVRPSRGSGRVSSAPPSRGHTAGSPRHFAPQIVQAFTEVLAASRVSCSATRRIAEAAWWSATA